MPISPITEPKLSHISAVADLMYERALAATGDESYAEKMYVLGFVHDIGYIFGTAGHAEAGGELLARCSFEYADEVALHGSADPDQPTPELDLLQWCDMSVGPGGKRMTPAERLADIGERYGTDSEQYISAAIIIKRLANKGMN